MCAFRDLPVTGSKERLQMELRDSLINAEASIIDGGDGYGPCPAIEKAAMAAYKKSWWKDKPDQDENAEENPVAIESNWDTMSAREQFIEDPLRFFRGEFCDAEEQSQLEQHVLLGSDGNLTILRFREIKQKLKSDRGIRMKTGYFGLRDRKCLVGKHLVSSEGSFVV
jgi:hypothetical protein